MTEKKCQNCESAPCICNKLLEVVKSQANIPLKIPEFKINYTHEDCPFLGYACGDYFCMANDRLAMNVNSKTVCKGCEWLPHILDLVCDKDTEKSKALAEQKAKVLDEIEDWKVIFEGNPLTDGRVDLLKKRLEAI